MARDGRFPLAGKSLAMPFWPSVEYGLRTLMVLTRFRMDARFGRWPLLRRPAVRLERERQRDELPARS